MPSEISLHLCLVWFGMGFFVGLGWNVAARLVAHF